jgi:hypothetical protein
MDAKGVSRLYQGRTRATDIVLLVASAVVAMLVIAFVSEPIRLFVRQIVESLKQFLFDLF